MTLTTYADAAICPASLPTGEPHVRKWLEAVPHLAPKHGGLSAVVPQLAERLNRKKHLTIEIAAFEQSADALEGDSNTSLPVSRWPSSRFTWLRNESVRARLQHTIEGCDGVHIHGLWASHSVVVARLAAKLKKPYIISAHGMLERWALAQKSWKKTLYSAVVERATLQGACCLHALNGSEAEDYRRFGCDGPIAIIPNAVDVPAKVSSAEFFASYPHLMNKQLVLFLGRIHSKKGLDILLGAWKQLAPLFADAVLVLAGPTDSSAGAALLQQSVSDADHVFFTGMLEHSMKWSALAAACGFVLPSYSEGQSVAILEALSMALPVIISHPCHMPEVAEARAGWVIDPTQEDLLRALTELLTNTAEANAALGRRGRYLFETCFTWESVSAQMAGLYAWVLGDKQAKNFVLLEGSR